MVVRLDRVIHLSGKTLFPRRRVKTRGALEHLQVASSATWCGFLDFSFGSGFIKKETTFDNFAGGQRKTSKEDGFVDSRVVLLRG
jgi:hypothetical protein